MQLKYLFIALAIFINPLKFIVLAGGAEGVQPTKQTKLVQERKKMYNLFLKNQIQLLDGCKQLSPGSEDKGDGLMFPVGLASPFFVNTGGVVAGFVLKNSHLERVWCLGGGNKPKVLNLNKYKNPIWKIEAGNFQRGTELGKIPEVSGSIDSYDASVFTSSTTSRYSIEGKEICSKATSNRPSGIIITEPCKAK